MTAKVPYDYVTAILDNDIVIYCISKNKEKSLKNLGGHRQLFERNKWHIKCRTDNKAELAMKLKMLRDLDFYFAGSAGGWPPAAVFSLLREEGYVSGKIIEIMWGASGKAIKREI